jgi:hypothetical protein
MRTIAMIIAALFLATGIAHAIEYQGKLPKPVQRLPSYPPVVCVAPNWAAEPCEDTQPRYWLAALAEFFERLNQSWLGTALTFDRPQSWSGEWPNDARADDDDEGGFPNEVRGLWCLSLAPLPILRGAFIYNFLDEHDFGADEQMFGAK